MRISALLCVLILMNVYLSEKSHSKLISTRQANMCERSEMCEDTPYGPVPCVALSAPKPLKAEKAIKMLLSHCPEVLADGKSTSGTCCADETVLDAVKTVVAETIGVKHCPACMLSIMRLICHVSCSTDQLSFSEVVESSPNEDGKATVREVNYYITEKVAKDMFESCRYVRIHNHTFEQLLCSDSNCDYRSLLGYIGKDGSRGGHFPYQANFIVTSQKSVEVNGKIFTPVSFSVTNCKDSCKCADCPAACS